MRKSIVLASAVIVSMAVAVPPSWAARTTIKILSENGNWATEIGVKSGYAPACMMLNVSSQGSVGFMKFANRRDIAMTLIKKTWAIPPGTPINFLLQIDGRTMWTASATGANDAIKVVINSSALVKYFHQFAVGHQLVIVFPQGTEPDWVISLRGSMAATLSFIKCMKTETAALATQPYAAAPTPPSVPTQPYTAAPKSLAPLSTAPASEGGNQV